MQIRPHYPYDLLDFKEIINTLHITPTHFHSICGSILTSAIISFNCTVNCTKKAHFWVRLCFLYDILLWRFIITWSIDQWHINDSQHTLKNHRMLVIRTEKGNYGSWGVLWDVLKVLLLPDQALAADREQFSHFYLCISCTCSIKTYIQTDMHKLWLPYDKKWSDLFFIYK